MKRGFSMIDPEGNASAAYRAITVDLWGKCARGAPLSSGIGLWL
jgi:hypothetical protein